MTVIFAEKPSSARSIAEALNEGKMTVKNGYRIIEYKGEQVVVTNGVGHLCELKDASDYNPEYKFWKNLPKPYFPDFDTKVIEKTKDQYKIVRAIFKKADLVINATDDDREGNLIFYYVCRTIGYKGKWKRVRYSSLTKEALRTAFEHLLEPDDVKNITDAGRARALADWIVGTNITVAMSLKYPGSGVVHVGRVQTPTLKMVADREKAIRGFKKQKYFALKGTFTTKDGDTYAGEVKDDRRAKKTDFDIPPREATVTSVEKKKTVKPCPSLFSQSSLAVATNKRWGMTLKDTLEASQWLYDNHYTTYPRTDSNYLPEDMYDEVNKTVAKLRKGISDYASLGSGKLEKKKSVFDSKKVSSHYAIIPTGVIPGKLGEREQRVYDLICRSLLAHTLEDATVENVKVLTQAGEYEFTTAGLNIIRKGWMEALGSPKEELLPPLESKQRVAGAYEVVESETKPPRAYTDASLVLAMIGAGKQVENKELAKYITANGTKGGIGTEATRAAIVENLIRNGYLRREGKKNIRCTDEGLRLIDIIPVEELKSPELTARWEKRLDDIAEGRDTLDAFVSDVKKSTEASVRKIDPDNPDRAAFAKEKKVIGKCPLCGADVTLNNVGAGCSAWRKDDPDSCSFFIPGHVAKSKLNERQMKQLLEHGRTSAKVANMKSKSGKKFSAYLVLNDEGHIVFDFGD